MQDYLKNTLDLFEALEKTKKKSEQNWRPFSEKQWRKVSEMPKRAKYLGTMPNGKKVYKMPDGSYVYE